MSTALFTNILSFTFTEFQTFAFIPYPEFLMSVLMFHSRDFQTVLFSLYKIARKTLDKTVSLATEEFTAKMNLPQSVELYK